MAPALGLGRSWSARSLGSSSGAAIPTTPTPITEHPARLHEPTKNETPTQLACPLRSRYVGSGNSSSPRGVPAGGEKERQRGGGSGRRGLDGNEEGRQQPQRRCVRAVFVSVKNSSGLIWRGGFPEEATFAKEYERALQTEGRPGCMIREQRYALCCTRWYTFKRLRPSGWAPTRLLSCGGDFCSKLLLFTLTAVVFMDPHMVRT